MKYTDLKEQKQIKVDLLLNEVGIFFAFSKDQFKEGADKYPLKEGEKYTSIGGGGYLVNSKFDDFIKGMDEIDKWFKQANKAIKADEVEREKMILYELNNYECFYTGELLPAYEILKSQDITMDEVRKVYKKNYQFYNNL